MTASPAKTVATKAGAIREVTERIAVNAVHNDRLLLDRVRQLKRSARRKPTDTDKAFVAGAIQGALATARVWIAASKLTALAYAMTGQTDPQLVHGDSVTLETPKARRTATARKRRGAVRGR